MPVANSIRRLAAAFGTLGVLSAALSGCGGGAAVSGGGGGGGTGGTSSGPSPTPGPYAGRSACTANTHQSGRARWTILVYMQAANNLQPDSLQNIAQRASVGSNSDVNIAMQSALTGTNGAILDTAHGPYNENGSHGLAIYVPAASSFLSTYSNLALAQAAANWPTFLKDQIQ